MSVQVSVANFPCEVKSVDLLPLVLFFSAMTHRERVLTALAHKEPDRCPWDLWATSEVFERLRKHLGVADDEAVLRHFDVDLRTILGPSYAGQP